MSLTGPISAAEVYGNWWLYELIEGARRSRQVCDTEAKLNALPRAEAAKLAGRLVAAKWKLDSSILELHRLNGAEVTVIHCDQEGGERTTTGIVSGYNLDKGSITLGTGSEHKVIPYCIVDADGRHGSDVVPIVTMQTDHEYKF